ncbi:MAG: CU044_2847 family protein [Anaerolineae bacterium]
MTQYIEFPTADGGTILVEVESEEQAQGLVKAGLGEKVQEGIIKVQDTFEATMMETVRRNAEAFIRTMQTISDPPAEAEITFGVKAAGEAGYSAIAKASGESTYTVTLTWKHESEEAKQG